VSALGHVIKLTSLWDDFGDAACLRFLQRQGNPWVPQIKHRAPAGNREGISMSSSTVSLRVRMLAAAAAVLALLAGGVAATATEASGDAGRGLHAGRGL
jgi:hypothetical protein